MGNELFIDTSGFFALLIKRDPKHDIAKRELARAEYEHRQLVTTDYVLAETATLLRARREGHFVEPLFDLVFQPADCRVEWTREEQFMRVRTFFAKHSDKLWSFTDCLSFCVMKELRIHEALSTDRDFEQAGFQPLLK